MARRGAKIGLIAHALALLAPLTLVMALFIVLSYPAYPIPTHRLIQVVFDFAVLIQAAAIFAAWYLVGRYLHGGHPSLRKAHQGWFLLVLAGAVLGILGAAIGVEHAMNPMTAENIVGFALLAPAIVLAPLWLHLWWLQRRGGRDCAR